MTQKLILAALLVLIVLLVVPSGRPQMSLNNGLITGSVLSTTVPVPAAGGALFVGTDGVFVAVNGAWVKLPTPVTAGVLSVNSKKPDATGNVALAATTSIQ